MSRIQSIDLLRVIAIFAVIMIHTSPFESKSAHLGATLDPATFINQLARFAVPYFFVISGFFWAAKLDGHKSTWAPTKQIAKRITFLFLAWSLIYLLPTNFFHALQYGPLGPLKSIYWNISNIFDDPFRAIFQGSKVHLWFLVSLLANLIISSALLAHNMERALIALSVALYVIGIAGKAYADTPIGFHAHFNFGHGPFFGLIFFVTGYILQREGPKRSWLPIGISLMIFGLCAHFSELLILNRLWGTTMAQEYVIGTYFFGTGTALIALSNNRLLRFDLLSSMGHLVLGIYLIHYVFVDLLQPLDQMLSGTPSWEIGYPVMVFALSVSAAYVMSKIQVTRKLIV